MENTEGQFLKEKYWSKKEFRDVVEESAAKKKRLAEDGSFEIPQKPGEKIPHYLERLEKITGRIDPKTGERGKLFLEISLYPKFIIKPENISDEYIKSVLLGNFAEQRGYERDALKNEEVRQHVLAQFEQETGHDFASHQIPEEERKRVKNLIITSQRARMKQWFEYLTGEEVQNIPAALRYWAFAEMLKLGSYDEKRRVFNKRTEHTAASFPELDQQALAFVFGAIRKKLAGEPQTFQALNEADQAKLKQLVQNENFGQLYAFQIEYLKSLYLPTERLIITKGEWRKFPKSSSPRELTKSLQGFHTQWCIAEDGFAQDYLVHSDVWIYFSEDTDGRNSIPRACIVDSKEHGITEVRGIMSDENAKQHLDSHITPVVEEKLASMPGGEKWQKTMEDMRQLARIHFKHLQNEPLTKDELVFIYEIDRPIQSSGYDRDPRIEEIKKRRNPREDAPIVFDCRMEQIAWIQDEISENTKAYIGDLSSDIFNRIEQYDIEYVYTSFPHGRIRIERNFESGPITLEEFKQRRTEYNKTISDSSLKIQITDYAKDIFQKIGTHEHPALKEQEIFSLVRLKARDLFQSKNIYTTEEIYRKAQEFGLKLCPPETGPNLRLKYTSQPLDEQFLIIAMKQIDGRNNDPRVFFLGRHDDGLWLKDYPADPEDEWYSEEYPEDEFVFRLRSSTRTRLGAGRTG